MKCNSKETKHITEIDKSSKQLISTDLNDTNSKSENINSEINNMQNKESKKLTTLIEEVKDNSIVDSEQICNQQNKLKTKIPENTENFEFLSKNKKFKNDDSYQFSFFKSGESEKNNNNSSNKNDAFFMIMDDDDDNDNNDNDIGSFHFTFG